MIDWDLREIEKMEKHYNETLNPGLNLLYFCRHFEEIYRVCLDDEVLIPDIFNDITYYTLNGINAKDKLLFLPDNHEEITEKLLPERMKQRAQRQQAHSMGLDAYYNFILREVEDFVKKYPYWKELLRQ